MLNSITNYTKILLVFRRKKEENIAKAPLILEYIVVIESIIIAGKYLRATYTSSKISLIPC